VHLSGVEIEEASVGQRGGRKGRCSVVRGVAVGVSMVQGGAEVGREWKTRVKRGS
jgi:hypothetical protein